MKNSKKIAGLSAAVTLFLNGCAKLPAESVPQESTSPAAGAAAQAETQPFLAERVSFSDLKEGDRFILVCPTVMRAVSSLTTEYAISAVRVFGDEMNITKVPQYTLSFTMEKGPSGFYLKSDAGYLSGEEGDWNLDLMPETVTGSEWIVNADGDLYNPAVKRLDGEQVYDDFCPAFRGGGKNVLYLQKSRAIG
jgi:hypothetical protein